MTTLKKKLKINFLISFILTTCVETSNASGQNHFSFEFLPGIAYAFQSNLSILQKGEPTLDFTAKYRTESLILPIYYSYRIGYDISSFISAELEMNHLKIILDNLPPEIEHFSITHGYNQLWINIIYHFKNLSLRMGAGPVISHPESIVRGRKFDEDLGIGGKGYFISGITGQISAQKKFFFGKYFFISIEGKFNTAYSKINIADGYAKVPVYAIHGLLGLGVKF